ncbi:MAG TPA: HPF/RaiA family ribosome-associated protein, partial [Polyangiaceae bacterium]|nr:HPF/RaiA family ribosome-associated protein [Polyangiaceae bacterium]
VQLPLQITLRGLDPSETVESTIRQRAAKLERFHERITRCHVTVDVPHRHHHKGRLFAVRIDLTTPTGEIVVTRNPADDHSHEEFNVVVRDAFNAAARQLEDQIRYRRGDVKTHEEPDVGRVGRIFPHDGYGFLVTPDELEVYFHENSVADGGFSRLRVGSEVRFVLAPNESKKGPQASTVRLHEREAPRRTR